LPPNILKLAVTDDKTIYNLDDIGDVAKLFGRFITRKNKEEILTFIARAYYCLEYDKLDEASGMLDVVASYRYSKNGTLVITVVKRFSYNHKVLKFYFSDVSLIDIQYLDTDK
jgi:hypothetical protein